MDVPNILRTEYTLLNIDDDFMNLIDQDGKEKDDVKVPEGEIGDQIQNLFADGKEVLVTVVSAMGEEHALAVKEAPTGVSSFFLSPAFGLILIQCFAMSYRASKAIRFITHQSKHPQLFQLSFA